MKVILVADETSLNKINGESRTTLETSHAMFSKEYGIENVVVQIPESMLHQTQSLIPNARIFTEPEKRGTAPAIGLALTKINLKNPDETILVAYSDHYVKSQNNLFSVIKTAEKFQKRLDKLILIGVNPYYPSTKFGYAKIGKVEEQIGDVIAFKMEEFKEKPSKELATEFLLSWRYLWNTGYLITSAKKLLSVYESFLPEIYKGIMTIKESLNNPYEETVTKSIYSTFQKISVDKGIYEKIDKNKIVVVSVDMLMEEINPN